MDFMHMPIPPRCGGMGGPPARPPMVQKRGFSLFQVGGTFSPNAAFASPLPPTSWGSYSRQEPQPACCSSTTRQGW